MSNRQPVNPYIAGSPVTGTEMFFGRQDVFSFIRRNLIGQHRDTPVVLYGQRRTGKTSVLYQMHRYLDPGYRCIFIDLHGLNLNGIGNLLLGIANSVSSSLRRDHQLTVDVPDRAAFLADPQPAFGTTFLDAVWSALGEDHLVLMLDEVIRLDEEVKAGRLERDIFDYLRHLMQHHTHLNFIFSLGSGLEEMKKDYAFLFSVALYHRISFLEPASASELITQPVLDHYRVAPQAVEKILQITSGHPYYTQLVCHCLFDLWSSSPKPVMDAADVEAVLAEAIELGSANLTYVWEDSLPGEQALMAGMASAMPGGNSPVTVQHVQDAWREVGVSLPERELAQALRSLTAREIVAGSRAYSFTVDLLRQWLNKHRRLDWVKEELPVIVQRRRRRARLTRRGRYLTIAAVIVLLAGYLTAAAVAQVFPFSPPWRGPTPQVLGLLPGDLPQNGQECHPAAPPTQWSMPGLVQALHCTDPGLAGGNVYAYQFDDDAHFEAGWRNFNRWWGFGPGAGKKCPPEGNGQGIVNTSPSALPATDRELTESLECGRLRLDASGVVPAYAYSFPIVNLFTIAEGGPGATFPALASWVSQPTPPVHVPVVIGISPASGPNAGGQSVIIQGTGLADATAVSFGGTAAEVTSDSGTQIVVKCPPGQGTVDIRVTTASGTSAVSSGDEYTYYGVRFTGNTAAPTVIVTGNGFGSTPPTGQPDNSTSCGSYTNNGDDYGPTNLWFVDVGNFAAGFGTPPNGSCIGIIVLSWSTDQVRYQFGNAYNTFPHWDMRAGDHYTLWIKGVPYRGTVNFSN